MVSTGAGPGVDGQGPGSVARPDTILGAISDGIVVSCQAMPGTPLARPRIIAALAQAAELGGAVGLRIEGVANIRAVQSATQLPVIGLVKVDYPGSSVRITPTSLEVGELCLAGTEIVAIDATDRPRPAETLPDLLLQIRSESDALVMADVATYAEGMRALDLGADLIGTTLQGYTETAEASDGPAYALMSDLVAAGAYVVAEGRVRSCADVRRCFDIGVRTVVVGGAVTDPIAITNRLVSAAPGSGDPMFAPEPGRGRTPSLGND